MRRLASLSLCLLGALLLAGCVSFSTNHVEKLVDGSAVQSVKFHDINVAGQDVTSTATAFCPTGQACQVIDRNSGYQRGFLGAVFQGTGPAAALALGNWAAAASLRPPRYNSTTTVTGGNATGGAGGSGLGGAGGAVPMAPGTFVLNGGTATANNRQRQGMSQDQTQATTFQGNQGGWGQPHTTVDPSQSTWSN